MSPPTAARASSAAPSSLRTATKPSATNASTTASAPADRRSASPVDASASSKEKDKDLANGRKPDASSSSSAAAAANDAKGSDRGQPRAVSSKQTPAPSSSAVDGQDDEREESRNEPGSPDTIDLETFNQIVELDEDDTHDFSHGMVTAYFSQARATFKEMEQALQERNLEKLSSLGHFLKGSSAALGVTKVQASCERMQHYGKRWDEENNVALTDENAFKKIAPLLDRVKGEYGNAEIWLKNWYKERGVEAED